ncbi:rubrerythrin family protein [Miniphocaeibacter halophilus]|uniref:Rubrerythrin-2 n=1 Tax=Miniphocaeibacter halophilus TaxID=2931922 RepID=A0AC61MQ10_9FIRM|nr:ferritin family protein [Miniphocaeibacter halophilus]QQK07393.1 Rubrerythrin-2 [Miniphocaeibacter halophilus]
MKDMTQANLRSAYGGESQARNRYDIWGECAGKDGYPNVERLFHCTADAEKIHAGLHFKAMKDVKGDFLVASMAGFGIGTTSENLEAARGGEIFEYTEMYPAYIAVAEMQEEKEAVRAMRFAIEAEKVHAVLFGKAKEAVDQAKDLDAEKILLCPICGFISITGEEEKCPICGALSSKFVAY